MKNLLKSFLLAATAFVLLAGCNQIGLSDATVDGATYSEGHCYLTISVDDLADMAAVDRSAARTINPVSLQDDATERAKITAFVLSGTSESTGDTYSKEFAIADFEANSGNSEKMQTKEDKKVVIPYGLWEFTLVAKDIDGRELLQGKSFANLKTANSEVSFTLKKNIYFKQSKYRVFLWKDSEFILVSSINVSSSRIIHCFKELDSYETTSGDWDNFKTLYTPHKKAGQAILVTSSAKIEQLENSSLTRLKNLLILYPTDKEYKRIQIISGIPCIGCLINSTD